ncbi:cilia- and flagella-associated protein 298 [Pelomyxa schiedti]|nr:cilia- and flagella-associated protein 298 [Pelomyxa schiedti]
MVVLHLVSPRKNSTQPSSPSPPPTAAMELLVESTCACPVADASRLLARVHNLAATLASLSAAILPPSASSSSPATPMPPHVFEMLRRVASDGAAVVSVERVARRSAVCEDELMGALSNAVSSVAVLNSAMQMTSNTSASTSSGVEHCGGATTSETSASCSGGGQSDVLQVMNSLANTARHLMGMCTNCSPADTSITRLLANGAAGKSVLANCGATCGIPDYGLLDPANVSMWWAGKELVHGNTLSQHIGKNEKTKILVQLRPGPTTASHTANSGEASQAVLNLPRPTHVASPHTHTQEYAQQQHDMMEYLHRRQEEERRMTMEQNGEGGGALGTGDSTTSYLNSQWADPQALRKQMEGLTEISVQSGNISNLGSLELHFEVMTPPPLRNTASESSPQNATLTSCHGRVILWLMVTFPSPIPSKFHIFICLPQI